MVQTARAIVACCGVSLLRGHRLARGWTLQEAASRLRALAQELPEAPRINQDQLGIWETHPSRRPRLQTVELLCRLYETSPSQLGLLDEAVPVVTSLPMPAPELPTSGVLIGSGDELDTLLDGARMSVDRTLAAGTVSSSQLDHLEQRIEWQQRAYMTTEPLAMVPTLLACLAEVRHLHADRQQTPKMVRLSEMTAITAALLGDAAMKLGRLPQAHGWYATAQTAADDSGNRILRARVRVQAAMLPYYYGPLDLAVSLTREARQLTARQKPSPTAAFAAVAEARALAQRGDRYEAGQAITHARNLLDYCDPDDRQDDAWRFPVRRMYLYLSGAHSALGQVREAREAQAEALRLYPDHRGIDPALLHLEAALCLVAERSPSEACELAATTYQQVPSGHRTQILSNRAHHVIDAIPLSQRRATRVRELAELLSLPPGHM